MEFHRMKTNEVGNYHDPLILFRLVVDCAVHGYSFLELEEERTHNNNIIL